MQGEGSSLICCPDLACWRFLPEETNQPTEHKLNNRTMVNDKNKDNNLREQAQSIKMTVNQKDWGSNTFLVSTRLV